MLKNFCRDEMAYEILTYAQKMTKKIPSYYCASSGLLAYWIFSYTHVLPLSLAWFSITEYASKGTHFEGT